MDKSSKKEYTKLCLQSAWYKFCHRYNSEDARNFEEKKDRIIHCLHKTKTGLNAHDILCYLRTEILDIYSEKLPRDSKVLFESHLNTLIQTGQGFQTWSKDIFEEALSYKRQLQKAEAEDRLCDMSTCCHILCTQPDSVANWVDAFGYCNEHEHFAIVRLLRKVHLPGSALFDLYLNRVTFPEGTNWDNEIMCDKGNMITKHPDVHVRKLNNRAWSKDYDKECTDFKRQEKRPKVHRTPQQQTPKTTMWELLQDHKIDDNESDDIKNSQQFTAHKSGKQSGKQKQKGKKEKAKRKGNEKDQKPNQTNQQKIANPRFYRDELWSYIQHDAVRYAISMSGMHARGATAKAVATAPSIVLRRVLATQERWYSDY